MFDLLMGQAGNVPQYFKYIVVHYSSENHHNFSLLHGFKLKRHINIRKF